MSDDDQAPLMSVKPRSVIDHLWSSRINFTNYTIEIFSVLAKVAMASRMPHTNTAGPQNLRMRSILCFFC